MAHYQTAYPSPLIVESFNSKKKKNKNKPHSEASLMAECFLLFSCQGSQQHRLLAVLQYSTEAYLQSY